MTSGASQRTKTELTVGKASEFDFRASLLKAECGASASPVHPPAASAAARALEVYVEEHSSPPTPPPEPAPTTKYRVRIATPKPTRIHSTNPLFVEADTRLSGPHSTFFLYLPPGVDDLVFVDSHVMCYKVRDLPVWKVPVPPTPLHKTPSWKIRPASGEAGLGMFASRPIKAGELLISERPAYLARQKLWRFVDQTDKNGLFHRNALSHLSSTSAQGIMCLKDSYGPEKEFDKVPGILNTNYLTVDISDITHNTTDNYIAIFPILSRANHSCSPSAHFFFDSHTWCGEFRAIRDIGEGDELTIWYVDVLESRDRRRELLKEQYFFDCTCEACELSSPELRNESDERRKALDKLRTVYEANPDNPVYPPRYSLDYFKTLLQYVETEKLEAQRGLVMSAASIFALQKGLLREHVHWHDEAVKAYKLIEGCMSRYVRDHEEATAIAEGMTKEEADDFMRKVAVAV